MYLISVYFDEKTNRILQRYTNQIADRTGNNYLIDNCVPPHMTVSAIEARSVDVLIPAFKELRGRIKKGRIHFVSVGQILPYVIYVTPVLNEYLLDVSKQVYEKVKDIPETCGSRYYQPLSWLPHVTMGKKLNKEQMVTAFSVLQDGFMPFDADVVGIGLAKVNPHEDVEKITF